MKYKTAKLKLNLNIDRRSVKLFNFINITKKLWEKNGIYCKTAYEMLIICL